MYIFLALPLAVAACASEKALTKSTESQTAVAGSTSVKDLSTTGAEDRVEVRLEADGPITHTAFKLADPPRLIVDMSNVDMSMFQATVPVNHELVKNVKPYYFAKSNDSRLEIELNNDVSFSVDSSDPGALRILITKAGAMEAEQAPVPAPESPAPVMAAQAEPVAAPEPAVAPAAEPEAKPAVVEPAPVMAAEQAAPATMLVAETPLKEGQNRVVDVKFIQLDKKLGRVEITMARPEPAYELLSRANMNRLTVDLPNTIIDAKDERLISVSAEGSIIKNVAAFQFRSGKSPIAKVVVNLEEMTLYNIATQGNRILLDMGEETVLAMATEVSDTKAKAAAEAEKEMIGAQDAIYAGARISLDFQKADIHNILRIIADVAGLNIITSEKVKGQVTMKLKNVPWDQALDVILKNNGLDKIQEGNIIRVATTEEISKEKETAVKTKESEAKIVPLYTRVFEVNYEAADKLKKNLDSMKSERGSVEINERTNSIIVKDTKEKLAEMASLIEKLDKKETQVLIEAKIVSATHDKVKNLGIVWGGYYNNTTGALFPNTIGVTGGTGVSSPNITSGGGGSAVNFPITAGAGGALSGIGLTLGSVNGTALLDARLMALEQNSEAVIISNPKITTMNNKEAVIESGQEVPYQTTSAEGTKTEFKKAVLSLKVTPHVTPDKHMRLTLQVNKDRPLAGSPPPIETRMAKTEVLVADGETAVLGGLFEDSTNTSQAMVPGLGRIPLLGWLFKNDGTTKNNQELLIFITPKIVD
ncbi:MAG: type IV pilus secretin PilQ [Nitrospinae bacterium]|nr:type IV pilus secretin PilQ [Nitrospinota bacterium]